MMAPRTTTMWVIFVGPPQFRGPRTRYVSRDGNITTRKQEAEKFSTAAAARDFAQEKGIPLDGAEYHVGQEIVHAGGDRVAFSGLVLTERANAFLDGTVLLLPLFVRR
jgi:hypothetical protein